MNKNLNKEPPQDGPELAEILNTKPQGYIGSRAIAMPADTNPSGDIFGGWLMSQMDLAGGTYAGYCAAGRVATIAVDGFIFHKPVLVGDELTCYCQEVRRGRTSLAIRVEAWVRRGTGGQQEKVTEGLFTFVAIDENREPRLVGDAQPEVCDC